MKPAHPPSNSTLEQLAREANEHFDQAEALARKTKEKANEAVAEALLCGKALNEAKEQISHGLWLPWLAKNCPSISDATARRYMRVSNQSLLTDLSECKTLQAAYIACGILPEPDVKASAPRLLTVDWFDSYLTNFQTKMMKVDSVELSPDDKGRLIKKLSEARTFIDGVSAKLAK